jgi:peroxiredoxin
LRVCRCQWVEMRRWHWLRRTIRIRVELSTSSIRAGADHRDGRTAVARPRPDSHAIGTRCSTPCQGERRQHDPNPAHAISMLRASLPRPGLVEEVPIVGDRQSPWLSGRTDPARLGAAACPVGDDAAVRALAVVVAAAAITVTACQTHEAPVHLSALHGTALDGTTVGAAQADARVLVLNFFGSWCPPCQAEEDGFASLADTCKADGVAFVGIAEREDSRINVQTFLAAHHARYPVLYDEEAQLELRVAPQVAIPTTLIFGSGKLLQRIYGTVEYSQLRDTIQTALRR